MKSNSPSSIGYSDGRSERLRRTAILCCHCLRNLAFYRAGWRDSDIRVSRQFWINANSNFLEIAVLEWCKLFAELKGKHHWKLVITDHASFVAGLCRHLRMSEAEFHNYAEGVLRFRDKFIAHLDEEKIMYIPKTRIARKSAAYLYEHLLQNPKAKVSLADAQQSASKFYAVMYRHAYDEYGRRA